MELQLFSGWKCVGPLCNFDVWIRSGLKHCAHIHKTKGSRRCKWVIDKIMRLTLTHPRAQWENKHRKSLSSTHTDTHAHCLDWGTDHIWENGSPFIAFIIIAPSPFLAFISPSPPLFSGCYLLLNLPSNSPGNLLCVSGWCVNDCTHSHPLTVHTYCVFMAVVCVITSLCIQSFELYAILLLCSSPLTLSFSPSFVVVCSLSR